MLERQQRGYAICTTARTGSTLLCEALRSTCALGNPFEFFYPDPRWRTLGPAYTSFSAIPLESTVLALVDLKNRFRIAGRRYQ